MAATRLIALHQNRGRTLAKCLADRIGYAENPDKTGEGIYIRSYMCDPRTASEEFLLSKRVYMQKTGRKYGDVIAYQIRQSFKPGEITPEEANRIGYELAMSFTKGKHAFIVATHTNRAHIHNHVIYNSTNLECDGKFKNFFLSGRALQRLSDILCLENGLSVIKPLPYSEREKYAGIHRSKTFRDQIREDLDEIIQNHPTTVEDLATLLIQRGYQCKTGKHLSVKGEGQKRFIRLQSLGNGYREEDILFGRNGDRIGHKDRTTKPEKTFNLVIDIQKKLTEGKGKRYEQWAKRFNAKQMAEVLLFLQEEHIDNYDDLIHRTEDASALFRELSNEIRSCEKRMDEISDLRRHIINYVRTKDVNAEYRKHGYSRAFFEAHREELALHKAAKEAFSKAGLQKLPKNHELNEEFQNLLARKREAYSKYHQARDTMKQYNLARKNVESFLDIDHYEENTPERVKDKVH